jgi:hypothetical protein
LTPTRSTTARNVPGSELYFDNSVYGFIDDAGEARAVRRWLQRSGLQIQASEEVNLGEALRTPDPKTRESRLKTIVTVAPRPTYPFDLVSSEELLGEVTRCRPGWIKAYPAHGSKKAYLRGRDRPGASGVRPASSPPIPTSLAGWSLAKEARPRRPACLS